MSARVIHLHASRFCNLACRHCYSESGPTLRQELSVQTIVRALPAFRREGYEVISLSGGEPLLYSGFHEVVEHSIAHGFRVNLITNGSAVGGRLLETIAEHVNLVAVSLDGGPDTHVALRGQAEAFDHAERALERLRAAGGSYGIAFTVSRRSLPDMPWALQFAREKGAKLVQFHPFAPTGRGRLLADELALSGPDKARAYVVAELLREAEGPRVHVDLVATEQAQARQSDYVLLSGKNFESLPLSTLVNPLIVDERGALLPFSYGLHPAFSFANLDDELPDALSSFKNEGWQQTRELLGEAFAALPTNGDSFVDWFYHLVQTSYQPVAGGASAPMDS